MGHVKFKKENGIFVCKPKYSLNGKDHDPEAHSVQNPKDYGTEGLAISA